MASNNILVNHRLSFEVNDSQIGKLMKWLRGRSTNEVSIEVYRNPEISSSR